MSQEKIYALCDGQCGTKKCLFKKSLWPCREDGFCIARTYHNLNDWIEEDEGHLRSIAIDAEVIKNRIKAYKQWKRKIENEIR